VDAHELEERIASFPRWHYQFQFENGISTPMPDRAMVNRHEQRRRYFFEALLRVSGGSLRGHRVLDLGCNAGFWSLLAIEAGADFVLGVDARQEYVEQAKLVFEAKGVERARYRFEHANVFELDADERFDVVLCLGLLDHVVKPVELFERMTAAGAELIVIDTEVSRSRSSVFEVERQYDARHAVDYELVFIPSVQAVIELAGEFGLQAVPLAHEISDFAGMDDYRRARRLAFIASKGASLQGLAVGKPSLAPWWTSKLGARRALARLRGA